MSQTSNKYTTIALKSSTLARLMELKRRFNAPTYDSIINWLIDRYNMCVEREMRERVRKTMCGEFRESKASLAGWIRLLLGRLSSIEEAEEAVRYLRRVEGEEEYIVDVNRCV